MGEVSQALGLGSTFVYEDKQYQVKPWTYAIQGLFERYLRDEAMKAYREMCPFLEPDEKKELLAQISRDRASGVYTFGSPEVAKAMNSLPHLKYLFWLMLKPNHPEVSLETAGKMVEQKLEEVYRAMSEANEDPTKGVPTPS